MHLTVCLIGECTAAAVAECEYCKPYILAAILFSVLTGSEI